MPPSLLPVFIKLANRSCLVVGAGAVATSKISQLLESGARVTVVAPRANPQVRHLAAAGQLRWLPRKFQPEDLKSTFLAIAATSDAAVNRAVFLESQRLGILCNSVDDPPHCDFYFSAVVRRGDLQIAISTTGESPAVAQRLRQEIDDSLDDSVADWLRMVGDLRREIIARHPPSDKRKRLLQLLAHTEICETQDCQALSLPSASAPRHLHLHEATPETQKRNPELKRRSVFNV
jgi:siroheme synthase-like protein